MSATVIEARNLTIYNSSITAHWKWETDPSSGKEVANLQGIPRFDIRGWVATNELTVGASYSAFLVFKLTAKPTNLQKAKAAYRFVKERSDDTFEEGYTVFIDKDRQSGEQGRFPVRRTDGWMEIELATFVNINHGVPAALVEFRLYNLGCEIKSGFVVRAIEIRRN